MMLHLFALSLVGLAVPMAYAHRPMPKIPLIAQRVIAYALLLVAAYLWGDAEGWEWGIPFFLAALMMVGFAWVLILRRWPNRIDMVRWAVLSVSMAACISWLMGA